MDTLQSMLLSTFYRQLVGLIPANSDVKSTNVSLSVNKKHHPIMLLSKDDSRVRQSIMCDKIAVIINVMTASGWIRETMYDRLAFER